MNKILLLITANLIALNLFAIDITFRVDMQNESVSNDSVFIKGSWDNWANQVLLSPDSTSYSTTLILQTGDTIEYKYLNGTTWEDFNGDCTITPNNNRLFIVPQSDSVLPVVCFNSCETCVNYNVTQYSIRQIQGEGDITPFDSFDVKTEGVITALNQYGAYIQDTSDTRSGIWVYEPELINNYTRGTSIQVTGMAEEYNGETSIQSLDLFIPAEKQYYATPLDINVWQVNEDHEGVLVNLDVEVTGTDQYNQYIITDELADTTLVDYSFFTPTLETGQNYKITGVVKFRYGSFRICPRDENDIEQLSVDITFRVDMQNESVSNDSVFIKGSWDNWANQVLLSPDSTSYSTTLTLQTRDTIEYKYLNGTTWEDFTGDCTITPNNNRLFIVPQSDSVLPVVCFNSCETCVNYNVTQYSIRQIQGEGDITPFDSFDVKTEGVITALNQYGAYIQDTSDTRSGIWVYEPELINNYTRGTSIQVTGMAEEYNGETSIQSLDLFIPAEKQYYATPLDINVWQVNEDHEGVLVNLDVEVTGTDQYNQYIITDELADTTLVDYSFFTPTLETGQNYKITGVVKFRYGSFRICPRDENDIEQLSVDITFRVDMQNESVSNDSVFIKGSWDNWANQVLLSPDSTSYSTTLTLQTGDTIEYKYLNGTTWEDFTGDCTITPNNNRLFIVPQSDSVLPVVCFNSCETCVNYNVTQYSIRQIQGEGDITPFDSFDVKTEGVITALNQYGAYIQDTSDTRSGIWVYEPELINNYTRGTSIQVTGMAEEYNGETSIQSLDLFIPAEKQYYATPLDINVWQVNEDHEGVLVNLDVEVTGTDQYSQYIITDELADTTLVDYSFFTPTLETGQNYKITGVVKFRYGSFRICPRDENDIEQLSVDITFRVDMQNESVSNDSVFIKGSWDNWTNQTLLSANGTVYSGTISVPSDSIYEYKFLNGVNGWETISGDCTEPINGNRIFTVADTNYILPLACFNNCDVCPQLYSLTLIANPSEGGTISGAGIYAENDTATVTASPNSGYVFKNWTLSGTEVSTLADYEFIVSENTELTANFSLIPPTSDITFQVDMQNETVASEGVFLKGSWDNWTNMLELSANNNIYYGNIELLADSIFEYKFINGNEYENFLDDCVTGDNNNRQISVPKTDQTLSLVCFNSCQACPSKYTISVISSPAVGGTTKGTGTYTEGEKVTLTATANHGYIFTNWTKNGTVVSTSSIYKYIVTEDALITANFEKNIPTILVTFQVDMQNESISNEGAFIRGSWDNWATAIQLIQNNSVFSNTIELKADSTYEYKFLNNEEHEQFEGDCTNPNNGNRILNLSEQDTILPLTCFNHCGSCPRNCLVTLYTNPVMGSVSGGGIYLENETVTISANANEGYQFVSWTKNDTIISNNSNHEFNANQDISLTANFELIPLNMEVTFRVDMQNELVSDSGVYINGSWEYWQNPIKLNLESDFIYSTTLNLPENKVYEYKFVNGGGYEWTKYENPTGEQVNIETGNRVIEVAHSDIISDLVCFNSSVACASNEPPVAFSQEIEILEDSVVTFYLQGIDNEDNVEDLVFAVETETLHDIEFTQNGNEITYRPAANYFGTDKFTFSVTDQKGAKSSTESVSIIVENVNDQPVASDININAANNNVVNFNLSSYISDIESSVDDLVVQFIPETSTGTGASVFNGTVAGTGTEFIFTANNPLNNEDFIVYRVTDNELNSLAKVITVTNLPNTKSAEIVSKSEELLTVNDSVGVLYGQTINLEFLGIDRIYPFEQLQVSIEKYPEHGELLNFSANEYGGSILTSYLGSYIATSNTNVLDSIVFNVYNDTKSITGVCYINIEAVKMAPRLASIASQKINEASSLEIELQVTDEDTKAEMLHWNISTVPDIDVAFEVKIENDVPVATYTPPPTFYGNVLIKTTVSDSDNLSDTKMFTLNIENTNDKPVIHFEDSITAFEDSTFSYTLKAEDFDKDSLMFSFSGLPQWLSFRVLSKYMVEIFGTPLQSDVGNNNITVAISDNKESIEEALILEVIETNDPLYQQTQIDTIFAKAGGDAVSLVLNDFFADDDPNANLDFDILENSNAAVATSTINNGILEIGFDNTELGTTNIVLEVSSQGDTLNTTIVVIVDSKVGIMDFDQNIEFAVYPNPIADKFTVKFSDGNSKWSVQALNLSGQIIFHKNIVERNEIILNATIFPSQGTYLIRAFSDETIKTQKVVIY